MTDEFKFFSYLLESYANYKNKMTGDVLEEWDNHNITDIIYQGYWQYHTEAMENAYADIDSLLTTGKHFDV